MNDMKLRAISLALLLAVGCATPDPPKWTPLESTALSEPLTLERCLDLARRSDVRAAQWQYRLDAARATVTTAGAIPNPTASITWEDVGLHDEERKSLYNRSAIASYPVLSWLTIPKKIDAASARAHAEEEAVRGEERLLAAQVGAAFFELVADQRRVAASRELVESARDFVRLVEKERSLGSRSGLDVERARGERLQAESDLADAEAKRRTDQLAFAFALGSDRPLFPEVVDVEPRPGLFSSNESSPEVPPDDVVASALSADPDWARAKALSDAALAELGVQQRRAIPLADTLVGAGTKREPEGSGAVYTLDLPIPIFDWNGGPIREAEAALQSARTEEEKARRAVVERVCEGWQRAQAAAAKWVRFARPLAETQERNDGAASRLFAAGVIGFAERVQAHRDWKQAQRSAVDSWRDAVIADWVLACALGKNDPPLTASSP
ncbi:MAG: TolC family protein [Planctomycetes bacterium]|nr:TolC family protein [Planctomycetota bacterium]